MFSMESELIHRHCLRRRRNLPRGFILVKSAGRGGLRELAVPCSSKFGSVRATRALQDDSMCFSLRRASARKSSVSRAWSCVVRRIPSGIRSSIVTRVASLI